MRRAVYTTSSAVTGCPSDQTALSSICTRKFRSSSAVTESASIPSKFISLSSSMRGRNIRPVAYLFISIPSIRRGFRVFRVLVTPIFTIFSPAAPPGACPVWDCPAVPLPGWDPSFPPALPPASDRAITVARANDTHLLAIVFLFFILFPPENIPHSKHTIHSKLVWFYLYHHSCEKSIAAIYLYLF